MAVIVFINWVPRQNAIPRLRVFPTRIGAWVCIFICIETVGTATNGDMYVISTSSARISDFIPRLCRVQRES
jgi:hypothetical protein